VAAVREDGPLRVEPSQTDLTEVISIAVKQDEAAKDPLAFVTPRVARGVAAVREDSPLRVEPSETDLTKVISIAVKQDVAAKDMPHDG
jgi:hypothetical protein